MYIYKCIVKTAFNPYMSHHISLYVKRCSSHLTLAMWQTMMIHKTSPPPLHCTSLGIYGLQSLVCLQTVYSNQGLGLAAKPSCILDNWLCLCLDINTISLMKCPIHFNNPFWYHSLCPGLTYTIIQHRWIILHVIDMIDGN